MTQETDKTTITDNRSTDTAQRAYWREKARRYYWSTAERRQAKIEAIERWRADNPDKWREGMNLARKRKRRGVQRAYRKD